MTEYPHTPNKDKGDIVKLLNVQIDDMGNQGKPQKILPFTQSKNDRIIIINNALWKKLKFLHVTLINKKANAVNKERKDAIVRTAIDPKTYPP